MRIRAVGAVLAAALVGCAASLPPPPRTVRSVAVFPPSNQTGDGLLVAGTSLLEKYAFDTDRVTVADVLGTELRVGLARRGFAVVSPDVVRAATAGRHVATAEAAAELARAGHVADPVLLLTIDRWEPDQGIHPDFIIVALDAVLVDPANGAVLWHAHRGASPIATPGTVTLGSAHEIAVKRVVEELLAP
jgi:hypothetical protein